MHTPFPEILSPGGRIAGLPQRRGAAAPVALRSFVASLPIDTLQPSQVTVVQPEYAAMLLCSSRPTFLSSDTRQNTDLLTFASLPMGLMRQGSSQEKVKFDQVGFKFKEV